MIPQCLDQCTFGFYDSKTRRLKGMLILHVDDMLLAGDMKGALESGRSWTRITPSPTVVDNFFKAKKERC